MGLPSWEPRDESHANRDEEGKRKTVFVANRQSGEKLEWFSLVENPFSFSLASVNSPVMIAGREYRWSGEIE